MIKKNNNRRNFIAGTLSIGLAAATAGLAGAQAPGKQKNKPGMVVHQVFFWLKNPTSAQDRDKLIEGLRTLYPIKHIKSFSIGVPASTEQREVVDNSYAVSELMHFKDIASQKAYQDDPIHQQFVKNCSHLWEKVVVYDSLVV